MTQKLRTGISWQVTALAILLAYKAIGLMDGLSVAERRVLTAIIDHFNRKTGQCDPGIDRLARLLGLNRRTVIRAIDRLAELGLIVRIVHGGKQHRNSYQPVWARFQEIEKVWNRSLKRNAEVANLSADQWRACHSDGGDDATQTCLKNQSEEPDEDLVCESETPAALRRKERKGQPRRELEGRKPYSSQPTSRSEGRQAAAQRRLSNDLVDLYRQTPASYVLNELIDISIQNAAIEAEMKRRGDGLRTVLERVQKVRPALIDELRHSDVHDGARVLPGNDPSR